MKRILISLFVLLFATKSAFAGTCEERIGNAFTPNQRIALCKSFGSAINNSLIPSASNTYDLGSASLPWRTLYTGTSRIALTSDILRVRQDAQRLFTWDASSDTAFTQTFGDGGVTAAQILGISASTADADDDSTLCLSGAGSCGSNTRGSYFASYGNEHATLGGQALITAGNVSGADVKAVTNDDFFFDNTAGTNLLIITDAGKAIMNGELGNQTTSYGCTMVTGANTACTTTCTTGCMYGQEGTTKDIVACTDATADTCLCCN